MKWFQHFTDSHENPKMKILLRKFGLEGYAICWILREIVGKHGSSYRLSVSKDWKILVQEVTKKDPKWLEGVYEFLGKHRFICPKALSKGALYIPKMKEYSDNWSRRLRSNSEVATEQLPIDNIRLDKTRLDKIIEEYITAKGWDLKDNKELLGDIYKRNCSPAKQLILLVKDDNKACQIIQKVSAYFKSKGLSWTLETILRHLPEEMSKSRPKIGKAEPTLERPDVSSEQAKEVHKLVQDVADKCSAK